MTDLDLDLARRLERLSAAVPVRAGQLDPVHAGAVAARHQIRMRWLTPLVALVIVLLALALLGGGKGPRPSDDASGDPNGPPVGVARDGDFALTLRAEKRNYAPDEPINVVGSLTYFGPKGQVEIDTDSTGPIQYGIRERVYGAIDAGQLSLLMCDRTTLQRNTPFVEAFKKGGGFDGDNPDAEKLKAWLTDKELRLPAGTWHLYAMAQAPCMGGDIAFSLRTEIEIVVSDDPHATPGVPVATDWQDKPVYGGDDIGNMTFQVVSRHPTYVEGTPIDLDAYYSFGEGNPDALRPFVQQVEYRITQSDPNAKDVVAAGLPLDCNTTTLRPMEERHVGLRARDVALITATDWPDSAQQALERGQLLLPPGHWRITVTVRARFGPCDAPTDTWEVHASVEIDVLPA
ncbi:MAG TPA: hypothetical protein VJ850_06400 [Candidatus Limnocylindrales bacterium]|nr:hypothetical protein [Candidatus Limnocylindrales bacterium]